MTIIRECRVNVIAPVEIVANGCDAEASDIAG
jgi:hypothetical protein